MVGPGNHFFDLTAEEDRVITPNNDKKVVARTKEEERDNEIERLAEALQGDELANFVPTLADGMAGTPPSKVRKLPPGMDDTLAQRGDAQQPSSGSIDISHLTDEQREVLQWVMDGHNVFFSGAAGTGKTFLLNAIIDQLRASYENFFDEVAVSAMTGLAASYLNGTTIHSALGLGVAPTWGGYVKNMSRSGRKIARLKALVVDEVSMMSGEMLQLLDHGLRKVRGCLHKPFGGLQVVFCGDLCQLGPVRERGHSAMEVGRTSDKLDAIPFKNDLMIFQAPAWDDLAFKCKLLTKSFRQAGDEHLLQALSRIRNGDTDVLRQLIEDSGRPLPDIDGIVPTKLYSRNANVDKANDEELSRLPGNSVGFKAHDTIEPFAYKKDGTPINREHAVRTIERTQPFKWSRGHPSLNLKKGAQVMLVSNMDLTARGDQALVNGTKGKVVGFCNAKSILNALLSQSGVDSGWSPRKGGDNNNNWSPKSATFDSTPVLLSDVYDLLRLRDLLSTSPQSVPKIPRVTFINGREAYVMPMSFSREFPGLGRAVRLALPLKLCWSLTVHKAQGATLSHVQVDISGVFAPGMIYTALSRVTHTDGLQVMGNVPEDHALVDPDVVRFYEAMERGEQVSFSQAYEDAMAARGISPSLLVPFGGGKRSLAGPSGGRGGEGQSRKDDGGGKGSGGGGREGGKRKREGGEGTGAEGALLLQAVAVGGGDVAGEEERGKMGRRVPAALARKKGAKGAVIGTG